MNFNLEFFAFCLKAFSRIIFPFFLQFQVTKMQTKRIYLNFLFKLLFLNSKFALTLGFLNPALNNPAPRLEESCLFKRERAYIVICLLAPRNEIQDGLRFWLPHHRFQIPGTRFRILLSQEKTNGTVELGFRIKYSGKLSRPGFRFSQAKIFQNFGVRTLSKVACAGENLTREKK